VFKEESSGKPLVSMKLRIRTKFIGILVIAAVLPLGIALITAQTLSYRYYRKAQGMLLETRARELARSLSLAVNGQVDRLHDWIALSDVRERILAAETARPQRSEEELKSSVEEIEARWPALKPDDEPVLGFLRSEIAGELHAFRMINPLFAEVFATNARGELLAATQKTSDYWQADEVWWQRAMREKFHHAFVEGIHYDASAGVYSLDVAVPIRDWQHPVDPPVGVVKGVVNASPLLSSFAPTLAGDAAIHQVVLADGRILAQLSGATLKPLTERIAPEAVARLQRMRPGWMLAAVRGEERSLAGYAPLNFSVSPTDEMRVTGITPMYVLLYRSADEALAPVRNQILLLSAGGALLILGCVFAGYWLAGKKILDPLEALRAAAQAIGASAKLGDIAPTLPALPALEPIRRIKTGDELQELAREFAYMAGRVLTYHDRLERDLAMKTAEIDRDLKMAREFQEALMPHEYPLVPTAQHAAAVALEFHHIYRPASSVGGDFFDVMKLSDHRAGIFIADVMGHGARSALVTAILRALLQNLAFATDNPATFLERLNEHFHEIVRESEDTIFVSAFYLIIDTETATANFASAGHPSPFVANRMTREVVPLVGNLKGNPALGLLPGARYSQWTRAVTAGDVFLLFTDGVHEAYNASGEEFGLDRVRAAISAYLPRGGHDFSQALVDAVHAFIQPAAPADDICLVTVEVTATPAKIAAPAPRIVALP
jgi:sigma-B regulation protein RsbU (phosphoserine phosphatase)